jgi:hypothetical protein
MSVPATAIADAYDRLAQQAVAPRYVRGARRHAKAPAALPMRRLVQAMGVAVRGDPAPQKFIVAISRAHVVRDRSPGAGLGVGVVGMSN